MVYSDKVNEFQCRRTRPRQTCHRPVAGADIQPRAASASPRPRRGHRAHPAGRRGRLEGAPSAPPAAVNGT